jgi:hypothetical protein
LEEFRDLKAYFETPPPFPGRQSKYPTVIFETHFESELWLFSLLFFLNLECNSPNYNKKFEEQWWGGGFNEFYPHHLIRRYGGGDLDRIIEILGSTGFNV